MNESSKHSYSMDLSDQVKSATASPVPSRVRQRMETYKASPTPQPQAIEAKLNAAEARRKEWKEAHILTVTPKKTNPVSEEDLQEKKAAIQRALEDAEQRRRDLQKELMEKLNAAAAKRKIAAEKLLSKEVIQEKKEKIDLNLSKAVARREEQMAQTQKALAAQEAKRIQNLEKLKKDQLKEAESIRADINTKAEAAYDRREKMKAATIQKLGSEYAVKREKVLQRKARELPQGA